MEFRKIDEVLGDSLENGDIVQDGGDFVQVRNVDEGIVYNLSTGDLDDDFDIDPDRRYDLYLTE